MNILSMRKLNPRTPANSSLRHALWRKRSGERGTVFMTTMISMFIMTLIATYVFEVSSQDLNLAKQMDKSLQALGLAEAGLAEALSRLKVDINDTIFNETPLGEGTYAASVSTVSGRQLVSSTGTVSGFSRTVTAEVQPPSASALNYILAGGSDLDLKLTAKSTATITGDIYAANNISMKATASQASIVIQNPGDVYAGGTITNSGGNIIYHSLNPNWPTLISFPVFDYTFYQAIAQTNGYYYNTNKTYTAASPLPTFPTGGVIYVNGNITISATQPTTKACLIATGSITISQGTTTINQYLNYPAMMTRDGDITIRSVGNSAQGTLVATGLVYAGNDFSISGNHNTATVTGSIIARGTLSESGTQASLTMVYQAQSPPGMTSSSATTMRVKSYNK